MLEYVSYEKTIKMVLEEAPDLITENKEIRLSGNADVPSIVNYIRTKPKGIIIQDTWNNFAFPIQPQPLIDTKKFDMVYLFRGFREQYTAFDTMMLPWHFVIESISGRYYAFNTRPLTMKYPLTTDEVIEKREKLLFNVSWKKETEDFFEKKVFDVEDAIHVAILGDSSIDVYPRQFYKVMGSFCLRPFYHYFRLPDTLYTRTFCLNVGEKFDPNYVIKFVKR